MSEVRYTQEIVKKPESGIIYRAGSRITSLRGRTEYLDTVTGETGVCDTLKSASGFGTNERAYEALEAWRRLGFKGAPASSTSFYREMYARLRRRGVIGAATQATANNLVSSAFYGGWIEVMQPGRVHGPIYHYDVNSAYLWAGGAGLPKTIHPYDPSDPHYMVLAWITKAGEELPGMMERQRRQLKPVLLTSEDVDHYSLEIDVYRGVSWREQDFKPDYVLEELAGEIPFWLLKRCTQSYWGLWAARKPIVVEKLHGGEVEKTWTLKNRFQHLVWAQIIISRIVRLVHSEARRDARLVYVDSILTGEEVATSERIGGWRLEEEFPKGVLIQAPGVWDRWPDAQRRRVDQWHRHAGYATPVELDR